MSLACDPITALSRQAGDDIRRARGPVNPAAGEKTGQRVGGSRQGGDGTDPGPGYVLVAIEEPGRIDRSVRLC